MSLPQQMSNLLNLSKNEQVVLSALEKGAVGLPDIIKGSRLPRMTVYSVLSSLQKRELVERIANGKRYAYILRNPSLEITATALPTSRYSLSTIQGSERILRAYRTLLLKHARKRVSVIQSPRSAHFLFDKKLLNLVSEINAEVKKNKVIMDVVTSRGLVDLSARQSKQWKDSMIGRTTGVTLLPDEHLDFKTELWIFDSSVLITNWERESCVVIKDAAVATMFQTLHTALKELGSLFDTAEFLRKSSETGSNILH